MADTIFAWTAPGSSYPEYVNFSLDGDYVNVTARAPKTGERCGETVTVRVPLDAWKEFLAKHDQP